MLMHYLYKNKMHYNMKMFINACILLFSVENVILCVFEVSLGRCSVCCSQGNGRRMVSNTKRNKVKKHQQQINLKLKLIHWWLGPQGINTSFIKDKYIKEVFMTRDWTKGQTRSLHLFVYYC